MNDKTITAIDTLIDKAAESKESNDALRFSQAALNLAHTMVNTAHQMEMKMKEE
jgi:hypothetical protein